MRFFQRAAGVAAVACVLAPAGPALGQLNQTPADQLRQMAEIIQNHGAPALDHLRRSVEGSKQCLMTDKSLRSRHLAAHGKTVGSVMYDGKTFFIEENITSSAKRGTYHLSKTFEATLRGNVVEITEPSPVVLLEITPNSPKKTPSLEEINGAPNSIRDAYYAHNTLEELFNAMRVAVYGACLNVEPPSQGDRASVYGGLSVAGVFSGQSTFQM
jgi:hypothetical protein